MILTYLRTHLVEILWMAFASAHLVQEGAARSAAGQLPPQAADFTVNGVDDIAFLAGTIILLVRLLMDFKTKRWDALEASRRAEREALAKGRESERLYELLLEVLRVALKSNPDSDQATAMERALEDSGEVATPRAGE